MRWSRVIQTVSSNAMPGALVNSDVHILFARKDATKRCSEAMPPCLGQRSHSTTHCSEAMPPRLGETRLAAIHRSDIDASSSGQNQRSTHWSAAMPLRWSQSVPHALVKQSDTTRRWLTYAWVNSEARYVGQQAMPPFARACDDTMRLATTIQRHSCV